MVADVIFDLRLPRVLIALVIGMNLASDGALMQAVMQNPLADPGVIGVSAGASVGGVVLMLALPKYAYLVPPAAFIGAMFAAFLIYVLAWKDGVTPVRIILSGVAINALLGSLTGLITILYSDRFQGALMWLSGSLSGKTWQHFKVLIVYSIPALILTLICIRAANVLCAGRLKSKKSWGKRQPLPYFSFNYWSLFSGNINLDCGDYRLYRLGYSAYHANAGRLGL